MLREEKALLLGGGVLAAVAAAGIFAMVSGGSDNTATQTRQPERTPVTTPETQPNPALLRQAQLTRMVENDRVYTGARGYALTDSAPRGQGQCTEDATIGQSGWYGGNTGLLYQAEKGGALYMICLSHGNEAVTGGRVMPLNPAPAPRVEEPAKPQIDQVLLNRMISENRRYLSDRGYQIVGSYEALGNCEDHGASGVFNDNAGWKGGNTGILYTIKDEDNNRYWACASHSNGRMQEPIMAAPK
jgi:hypothetical protein